MHLDILFEPQHSSYQQNHVCPAKNQISLSFRVIWTELLLCAEWVAKDSLGVFSKGERKHIRLCGCAGWSESSLATHVILLVLSCSSASSFRFEPHHEKPCLQDLQPVKIDQILASSGVCDQLRLKPACSVDETSLGLEILAIASRGIILSRQWSTKALNRLHGCYALCCSHMA